MRDVPNGLGAIGAYAHKEPRLLAKCQLSALQNYTFQRHSPGGDTRIDVLIYSAPQLPECLMKLLTYLHSLRAYILHCVPRYTATRLVDLDFGNQLTAIP